MKNFYILLLLTITFISCDKNEEAEAALTISSIYPTTGPTGTIVMLTGTGFSTTISENEVTLNNIPVKVNKATSKSLSVAIPARAGIGKIIVRVKGAITESTTPFTHITTAMVSTLAGSTRGFADGIGTQAQFTEIVQMMVAPDGSLYATDQSNDKIRKISPSGVVSTFAGSTRGHSDGVGLNAQFTIPSGIVLGSDGIFYVSEFHQIRTITGNGVVGTLAGSRDKYGDLDGPGATAQLYGPFNIDRAANGNLYVSDIYNYKIRQIAPDGTVSTLAGGGESGHNNGTGIQAKFFNPSGIKVGTDGNVYVTEYASIRKITPAGVVTTFAGGEYGYADGNLTTAKFRDPYGMTLASDGTMYVADTQNNKIRKISTDGQVTTLAGSEKGYRDGLGEQAMFHWPVGIAIASDSILYVSEGGNFKIRKIVLR